MLWVVVVSCDACLSTVTTCAPPPPFAQARPPSHVCIFTDCYCTPPHQSTPPPPQNALSNELFRLDLFFGGGP